MVQTDAVYHFLSGFAQANQQLLSSVPLQSDLTFGDQTSLRGIPEVKAGDTLADLLAIVPRFNNPEPDEEPGTLMVDSRVIYVAEHLKKELYAQTTLPLLVAIDQFNFLFDQSGYRELKGRGMITPAVPVSRREYTSIPPVARDP